MAVVTRAAVRKVMKRLVQDSPPSSYDGLWDCGVVNVTTLAETAACEVDAHELLLDGDHWIWDLAFEVAGWADREKLNIYSREEFDIGLY